MDLDPNQRYCVVCGMGSHRADWIAKQGPVACDSHSKAEVDAALAKQPKASASQVEGKVKTTAEKEFDKAMQTSPEAPAPATPKN